MAVIVVATHVPPTQTPNSTTPLPSSPSPTHSSSLPSTYPFTSITPVEQAPPILTPSTPREHFLSQERNEAALVFLHPFGFFSIQKKSRGAGKVSGGCLRIEHAFCRRCGLVAASQRQKGLSAGANEEGGGGQRIAIRKWQSEANHMVNGIR